MTTSETASTTSNRTLAKSLTGIRGLDEITQGGLPKGRPTLICGKAGSGKTLLAMEFLVRGATLFDEPGVFVSFEESATELVENVASFGWGVESLIAKNMLGIKHIAVNRSDMITAGDYDLEALFVRMGRAIDAIKAKRVVIDTLEVLIGAFDNSAVVRSEIQRLFLWLKAKGLTAIVTCESGETSLTRHGLEEYVSDCVILLDQRMQNELSTRRLHIVKYRGSQHGSNEYPFLIEQNGISVQPLSSITLDYQVSDERISSGIERLDHMLGGSGFFRGSSILISGTAGTGKSSLCANFANAACERGEKCLYFAFEESPNQIIRNMRSISIDLEQWVKKDLLRFQAIRPSFYGLELHLVKMHQVIHEFQPQIVIIDPISNLDYAGTLPQIQSFMMRLLDFLKNQQITTLTTNLTPSAASLEHTEIGISSLMDTWLMLRDQENNGERNRLIYILKSRGTEHSNQVREFRLTRTGVQLTDVYLGEGVVLAGTARLVQESRERAAEIQRRQEVERKQREIERRRLLMEMKIQALHAEFEAEKEEIEQLISQEEGREQILQQNQMQRARLRYADKRNGDNM